MITEFAPVRVSDSDEAAELALRVVFSNTAPVAKTGLVDRAFADWDGATDDLVLSIEIFASRRRLKPTKS